MIKGRRLLLLLLFEITSFSAVAEDARYVNVQQPLQIAPDLVKVVARLGMPDTIAVSAGTSPLKLIGQRCGGVDPGYVKLFLEANPIISKDELPFLSNGQKLSFPACARLPESGTTTFLSTELIANVARLNSVPVDLKRVERILAATTRSHVASNGFVEATGLSSDALIQVNRAAEQPEGRSRTALKATEQYYRTVNADAIAKYNPELEPRRLKPGDSYSFPGVQPTWSSIRLREGVSAEEAATEIASAIQKAGVPSSGRVQVAKSAELVGSVSSVASGACAGVAQAVRWPYDIDKLISVLALNREVRLLRKIDNPPTSILILDTGFDFVGRNTAAFPIAYLQRTKSLPSSSGPDQASSANYYDGVNFATNVNDPSSAADYIERWHGAGVAGAALGSRSFEAYRRLMAFPLKIAFASVVKVMEGSFEIEPTSIYRAYKFARDNKISIINVSLSMPASNDALEQALQVYGRDILLIAAAGNDGEPIESSPTWPAIYGGNPANAGNAVVITVGAHDQSGNIAAFSRRGDEFVDVLAPGCHVPTYKGVPGAASAPRLSEADASGTSFAAPLVSFVAALLNYEGLAPFEIKARFISAADVSTSLDSLVYSRGILNPSKALAIWHDVVEYDDNGKRRSEYGRVVNREDLFTICGTDIRLSEIRKLAFTKQSSDGAVVAHVWKASADPSRPERMRRWKLCAPTENADFSIKLETSESGEIKKIPLVSLYDYVPSWYDRE